MRYIFINPCVKRGFNNYTCSYSNFPSMEIGMLFLNRDTAIVKLLKGSVISKGIRSSSDV